MEVCKELFFTFVKSICCKIEKNQDTMKERIAHIMRSKNLKASDFASLLGIQPSAISHILAGRNKPSLEIVKKIKETFPEYNLDWIVFGIGPMTSSESSKDAFQEARSASQNSLDNPPFLPNPIEETVEITENDPYDSNATAQKVIVLYDDGTFDSYRPR